MRRPALAARMSGGLFSVAVGLLLAGCSGARLPVASEDATSPAEAGAPLPASPAPLSGAVYVATAGVSTPYFAPVPATSSAARLQRIGPARGSGYGLGEGSVRFVAATAAEQRVLVVFETRQRRQILFALATDGSAADAPVRVADATALNTLDVVLSPDGEQVLYVDDGSLYRARLDGADASSPIRLAAAPVGARVARPRWAPSIDRAIFELERDGADGQTVAVIYSVRLDGSDADGPRAVSATAPTGQHRAGAVLSDGRIIAMLKGRVLWAVPGTGGAMVRLTPRDWYASLLGVIDDGARLVVELWQPWPGPRLLATVATDGSQADEPTKITSPVHDLQAVLSTDGQLAAFVAQTTSPPTSWALFKVPTNALSEAAVAQITRPLSYRPYLAQLSDDRRTAIGCSNAERSLLRFDLPGSATARPTVLFSGPDTQQGCPSQMILSADQTQVIYSAHDDSGTWVAWRVAVQGGAPSVLAGAGYHSWLLSRGVVAFEDRPTSALFATVEGAAPVRLTPDHPGEIAEVALPPEGSRDTTDAGNILYATTGIDAAWYVVQANGDDRAAPRRVTSRGAHEELVARVGGKAILARRQGDVTQLLAFALDRDAPGQPEVLASAASTWRFVRSEPPVILFAQRGSLHVLKLGGPEPHEPVPVMADAEEIAYLGYDPTADQAICASSDGRVRAARCDGSERTSSTIIADVGYALFHLDVVPRSGRVLLTLATLDTAVPHPRSVLTARTNGMNAAVEVPLAPVGYLLLAAPSDFGALPTSAPLLTPDQSAALLRGPGGLYAARIDGSEAAAPRLLLGGEFVQPVPGLSLPADGRGWVAHVDGAMHYFVFDASASPTQITPKTEGGDQAADSALWADQGRSVVYQRGDGLFSARITGDDAAALVPLVPADVEVGRLQAIDPTGKRAVLQTASGPDRSLLIAPVGEAHDGREVPTPEPLTPIDDAAETLVGFLHAD